MLTPLVDELVGPDRAMRAPTTFKSEGLSTMRWRPIGPAWSADRFRTGETTASAASHPAAHAIVAVLGSGWRDGHRGARACN